MKDPMNKNANKKLIERSLLQDGSYYVGLCRNATVARWNAKESRFYHWQLECGSLCVETIRHPEDETRFDVFSPMRLLENPKFEIPFEGSVWKDKSLSTTVLYEYDREVWCACENAGTCKFAAIR